MAAHSKNPYPADHLPVKRLVLALNIVLGVSLLSANAFAEGSNPNNVTVLDSIIVSGEKIERSLKDTTSSVSVITEDALATTENQTITDAIDTIPNVVTTSGNTPSIRGISGDGAAGGFNSITGGAKPRVSLLIDGVAEPFVADWTGDSDLWDFEQIEVFRGPQSTTNGRSSIGGSINLKSKDPTVDWEGAVRLGLRNQEEYKNASAVVSGPLIKDKLAFRLSMQNTDGQTVTSEQGYADNAADYDLNELNSQRIRGKLLWTPNEKVDVLLSHSSADERGDTGRIFYSGEDPWSYNRIYFRDMTTKSDTTTLKSSFQISDHTSFEILAANTDYEWGFDSYTATAASEQQLDFDENDKTLEGKLSFGEGGQRLNGIVGLAYSKREQEFVSAGSSIYNGDDESSSKAAFGEVNYDLNDRFTITAGLRLERESQDRNFTFRDVTYSLDESKTITLPKIALQYYVSDQTTLGFSARQGYNSAGGALDLSDDYYYYDEERVNTYEVSVRSDYAGGKYQVNSNLFYNDYDGYQAVNSSRRIVNMDKAVSYGAEIEAIAKVSPKLTVNGGLGLLKTDIKDAGDTYADVNGNELNMAPAFTANVDLKYAMTEKLNIGLNYNYIDEYYSDLSNSEDTIAGGYGYTNLKLQYKVRDFDIAAFVNNVTDVQGIVSQGASSTFYPDGYSDILAPRSAGLSVTYSF
ncbi:TonB-dependent receptor [Leucothrix arctica]|uniref:TonB-dependent receptor n=1 Tax=Leucothrix arctica TaxID=1481894 RepID=A0A317CCT7_9GAMM|nr:TonB-dependent receptor [Leucothrix arctica]PWQ95163.1 TonB-dependent receptor [Leucothrix arctica]